MFDVINKQVHLKNGICISYEWIRHTQESNALCIMLPGLGYTTQKPLFHYSVGVFLQQNTDVLLVNYNYKGDYEFKQMSKEERSERMYEEGHSVIQEVLQVQSYEKHFLLSKSIGSIPMSLLCKRQFRQAYCIWLTPLLTEDVVYNAMREHKHPSVSIIGTADPFFIPERWSSLNGTSNTQTLLVPDANHSLEIEKQPLNSIDILKDCMEILQQYVKGAMHSNMNI